jgi:hypothetical protein
VLSLRHRLHDGCSSYCDQTTAMQPQATASTHVSTIPAATGHVAGAATTRESEVTTAANGAPKEPDDAQRWRTRTAKCSPGQELTELDHLRMDYHNESALSVVRVAPSDHLNLRAHPGVGAAVVAELPFLAGGLIATGHACRTDGAVWLEVSTSGKRGWVSSSYAQHAAALRVVEAVGETRVGTLRDASFGELGARLRALIAKHARAPGEPPAKVLIVGQQERDGTGQIVLTYEAMGDDSIAGVELMAHAVRVDDAWTIAKLEQRELCRRGTSDGYCI